MSPVVLNVNFLLGLWLKEVPDHTSIFVILTLLYAFLDTLTAPLVTGVLSTAKIKWYELQITFSYIMMVVAVYFSFKSGLPPETAFLISILCKVLILLILLYNSKNLYGLPFRGYLNRVLIPVGLTAMVPIIVYIAMQLICVSRIWSFVFSSVIVSLLNFAIIWILGLDATEKSFVKNIVYNKILKQRPSNG